MIQETYILYYLNDNYTIQTLEVDNLDTPIFLPENLIFTNIRKGVHFIRQPHECIKLTHLERLIISTEFFDMSTIKQADFRRQNTYLEVSCSGVTEIETEKINCNCHCDCGCTEPTHPVDPVDPVGTAIFLKGGTKVCQDGMVEIKDNFEGNAYIKKADASQLVFGDIIYQDQACTVPLTYPFVQFKFNSKFSDLTNGALTHFYSVGSTCAVYRYLLEVQLSGVKGEVITLRYIKADGTGGEQTWTVGGNGEAQYYTFGVGECVRESSVGIDGGTLIQNVWVNSISCPITWD